MDHTELLPLDHPLAALQAAVIEAEAVQAVANRLWKRVSELASKMGVVVVYPQGT